MAKDSSNPRFFLLIVLGILVTLNGQAQAQPKCTQAPSAMAMNDEYIQHLRSEVASQDIRVAIFPFQDGSEVDADFTLARSFPILLDDDLRPAGRFGLLHPFVVWDLLEKKSFPVSRLFSHEDVLPLAQELGVTHVVLGMFQKLPDNQMRFFIKLVDVKKNQSVGPIMEFLASETDRFFSVMADASETILNRLGTKTSRLSQLQSPSYEAFRYYVKGMEKSRGYQETDLTVASAWFEKALGLSYHFRRAAEERARTLLMLALIQRQMGQDPSLTVSEAQGLIPTSLTVSSVITGKKVAMPSGALRLWQGYTAFTSGMGALAVGQAAQARSSLEQSVQLVPEDGIARYQLSQVYRQQGNIKEAQEKTRALQLNPCLSSAP